MDSIIVWSQRLMDMDNYQAIRESILTGKITRISQLLKRSTPPIWARILGSHEINARMKIRKKGTTLILREAYALATYFKVDVKIIIDLIREEQWISMK